MKPVVDDGLLDLSEDSEDRYDEIFDLLIKHGIIGKGTINDIDIDINDNIFYAWTSDPVKVRKSIDIIPQTI
jgi:hypothetical protein